MHGLPYEVLLQHTCAVRGRRYLELQFLVVADSQNPPSKLRASPPRVGCSLVPITRMNTATQKACSSLGNCIFPSASPNAGPALVPLLRG